MNDNFVGRWMLIVLLSHCLFVFSDSSSTSYIALIHHGIGSSRVLRIRGGSSAAAQLAEIRARRAKEYEETKAKDAAAYVESSISSPWTYAQAKINPSSIGTLSIKMMIGDARNYYMDQGATVFRNRNTGMSFICENICSILNHSDIFFTGTIVELLDDSTGWFQYCASEGNGIHEVSAGAGNVYTSHRWYVPGVIEQMKQSPVKSSSVKPTGLVFGCWKAIVDGEKISLVNSVDGKSQVQLHKNGVIYMNCATDEALEIDGCTGKLSRRQLKQEEWHKL
jgi:hypothetical protein